MGIYQELLARPLSDAQQLLLATTVDAAGATLLSQNAWLTVAAANILVGRFRPATVAGAMRITTDQHALTAAATGGPRAAATAMWSPHLEPDLLAAGLRSDATDVATVAAGNPATPEAARQRFLTRSRTQALSRAWPHFASCRFVRAVHIVATNPWMRQQDGWCTDIRRGLAATARLTTADAERIRGSGWAAWPELQTNPGLTGFDIDGASLEDLLTYRHPMTDLAAVRRDSFGVHHLPGLLGSSRRRSPAAPHVLAALVAKCGPAVLAFSELDGSWTDSRPHGLAGTRLRGAAWATPAVKSFADTPSERLRTAYHPDLLGDYDRALTLLGDTSDAWTLVAALDSSWTGTPSGLAAAALDTA